MPSPGTPDPPVAVHLLVDTGVDDALAVIAAALHPAIGLAEVTVCAGNVPLRAVIGNTRLVLAVLAAHPDTAAGRCGATVATSRGAAARWDGRPFAARTVHGQDGLAGLRAREGADDSDRGTTPRLLRVTQAAGTLVCVAPQTTLTWLRPGRVLVTYGREGEGNHDLDPDAARQVAGTWSVSHAAAPPALTRHDLDDAWNSLTPTDRAEPLARLVQALLRHQVDRGAGLGDADAVLRLAGSTDPLGDLVDALRR